MILNKLRQRIDRIIFSVIAKMTNFRLTGILFVGGMMVSVNISYSQSPPLSVIAVTPIVMNLGQTIDLDMTTVFFGGQQLASPPPFYVYNGSSDNLFVATFAFAGDLLTLDGVGVGTATITIQATDDLAASISTMFTETEVTWDGREYGGHSAASGVYFYRLRAGDVILSRSMILLR